MHSWSSIDEQGVYNLYKYLCSVTGGSLVTTGLSEYELAFDIAVGAVRIKS